MWGLIRAASVAAFLVSGVLVLYGFIKVSRAEQAGTGPGVVAGAEGVEITRVEPAGAPSRAEAMAILVGSGLVCVGSLVAFGYATSRCRRR